MKCVLSRPATKSGSFRTLQVQRNRGLDAFDHRHLERPLHPRDRFLAIAAVHDDLGDHRVVVRRNRALGVRGGVDAHAGAAGDAERVDGAGRRHERDRIFGVDAALDGVPGEGDLALLERQALAGRDADLLLDDVDAGHPLGDRVLDLDAGVHFHEVEVALRIHQELERAGVGVLHGARGVDDRRAHLAPHLVGDRDRRRLLDQLLVAALDRALALAQVHDVAVMIAEDLVLDVPRRLEILLDVDIADAERRLGLALRRAEGMRQFLRLLHDAHAAAAAAGHRLDDHRDSRSPRATLSRPPRSRPGRRCRAASARPPSSSRAGPWPCRRAGG